MTVIAGRVYSDELVLSGLEIAPVVAHSARRTFGRMVVQAYVIQPGGRPLVLDSKSHLTLEDVEALRLVAEAGQPVSLVHHRGAFTVLITGIDVEPDEDLADPGPDTWYSGSIYLQEI